MLPLLLSLTAHADPPAATEIEIEVLSLNIWGLAWPISKRRGPRMQQLHTLDLTDYDVVGLQEVWRGAWRRIPWREDILRPQARGDSGLALTGRLVTEPPSLVRFQTSTGVERLKGKGILIGQVTVPDIGPLWVFVTHLQAGPRSGEERAAQADQLIDLLDEHPGPAVVIGDFNLYRDHPLDADTEQRLADAGLKDAALHAGDPEATYIAENPYIWKGEDGERFDRIYLRSGPQTRLKTVQADVLDYDEPLSDHQPVLVRIQVTRAP